MVSEPMSCFLQRMKLRRRWWEWGGWGEWGRGEWGRGEWGRGCFWRIVVRRWKDNVDRAYNTSVIYSSDSEQADSERADSEEGRLGEGRLGEGRLRKGRLRCVLNVYSLFHYIYDFCLDYHPPGVIPVTFFCSDSYNNKQIKKFLCKAMAKHM